MSAEKINLDIVTLVKSAALDMLRKCAMKKIVMFLVVKEDTPKFANL